MNKLKMSFLAATLALVTIAVFAGKAPVPVAQSLDLYVDVSGTKVQITDGAQTFTELTTTSGGMGIQAQIKDRNNVDRPLYHFNGSNYVPVYSTSAW